MASGLKNLLFGGKGTGSTLGDLGLTVLRLNTGLLIALGHGLSKVYADGRIGPGKQLISSVEDMGFSAPTVFAWCTALAEFLGGLFIAAGLLTRPAALALAFNMGVAIVLVHGNDPWYGATPSKEFPLLYFAPAILLMLTGAGRISADALITGGKGSRGESRSDSK